jgi:hypothetical protein
MPVVGREVAVHAIIAHWNYAIGKELGLCRRETFLTKHLAAFAATLEGKTLFLFYVWL